MKPAAALLALAACAVPAFGAEDQPVFGESRPLGLPSL